MFMIAYLKGNIIQITSENIILLINNIGYEIKLPARTLQTLTENEEVEFFIYTHVRQDQFKLFGFETIAEKSIFTALLNVSGVGPKSALLVLSQGNVEEIEKAIAKAQVEFFTQIKGVGKKAAQKIIIELKSKVGSLQEIDLSGEDSSQSQTLIEALQSFGFKRRDFLPIIKDIDKKLSEAEQIKQALKLLGKA
jgi:holliday junction DNA helicase RuvA